MLTTARKLLDLLGQRRGRWFGLGVFAAGVSVLDMAAALLVFGLLQMLSSPDQGFSLPVVGDPQRFLPQADVEQMLLAGALVVAAVFLVRGAAYAAQTYLQHRVAWNTAVELAARLVGGYLAMPYEFHLHRNSAELVRNAFDAIGRVAIEVLVPIIRVVSEALIVVGLMVVLFLSAPSATLLVAAVFTPTIWVLLRVVNPRLKRLGRVQQDSARASLQSLQQAFSGLRDIKLLGREAFFADDFRRHRQRLARARYLRGFASIIPRVTIETVLVLLVAVFLVIVVVGEGSPEEAFAVLGLFGYAAFRTLPSLTQILSNLNSLKFAGPTVDDVHTDISYFDRHGFDVARGPVERLALRRELRAEELWFRYEGAEVEALQGASLLVPRSGSLGVVGATGGGKTTLVDLLCGLLEPTRGRVAVDGVDIRENLRGWQESLGVVPQSIFLLDDTLRRNIAFGLPEGEINDEQVQEAVRLAQLEEFVVSSPKGLNTMVGERGVRLSGGQRQRVAIARALYRRPDVLVFDEATSALDNITERDFMRALRARVGGLGALIMVAHRISTVRDCDEIIVVADGRIVERGTYQELLERSPAFREMASGRQ